MQYFSPSIGHEMVLHQNRSMLGEFHGHGEGRVEGTTGSSSSSSSSSTRSLSGDKLEACRKLNGPGNALLSEFIREGASLSCITSELALSSSSRGCRREDESRALTFTDYLLFLC